MEIIRFDFCPKCRKDTKQVSKGNKFLCLECKKIFKLKMVTLGDSFRTVFENIKKDLNSEQIKRSDKKVQKKYQNKKRRTRKKVS